MRHLLLLGALLAPVFASAQAWTFDSDVTVPYTTAPGSGLHGVAIDSEGRLWVQNYYGSEPLTRNGADLTTRALYVLNPDGSQAPCSPIVFIKDNAGTVVDTLGYYTTAAGALDSRTGRGITSDADGNILVSQFDVLYQFDATSCTADNANSIKQIARTQPFPGVSITSAAADDLGNVYVESVVSGGRPVLQYGPGLTPKQNVAATAYDISRDILASSDGTVVIDHAFTKPGAVVHYRPTAFSAFDSLGVTLRGLAIESSGVHPVTGDLWFSSGPGGAINPNEDPTVETFYQPYTWYAYAMEDLLVTDNGVVTGTVENPTPRDSIVVADAWAGTPAGPRGIAFSADGTIAYVASFGVPTDAGAIKKFVRGGVAAEGGPDADGFALAQNRPNPFSGRTEISFSLAEAGHVRLGVYDLTGRQVASLVDAPMTAGSHTAPFDANGLAAGMYLYTLEVDGRGTSRRMAVIR